MAIEFNCPQCGKAYRVSDELAGRMAKCRECSVVMTIPAAPAGVQPASSAPQAAAGAAPPSPPPPQAVPMLRPAAEGYGPPRGKRPASVTVVSILGLISAGYGLLVNVPLAVLQLTGAWPMTSATRRLWRYSTWRSYMTVDTIITAIFAGLWLAAAIGMLRMRKWGRQTAMGILVVGILLAVAHAIIAILIFQVGPFAERMEWMSRSRRFELTMVFAAMIVGSVFALAWGIVLLALLARRKVAEAFDQAEHLRRTQGI